MMAPLWHHINPWTCHNGTIVEAGELGPALWMEPASKAQVAYDSRMSTSAEGLRTFYEGWANYQGLVEEAIRGLTPEQLGSRTAPHQWAVWQLAGHMAGSRAYWFHDILGEGEVATSEMFRVDSTTVPDLPLEDAGWEDDEDHPRGAAEIVEAFDLTWTMIDECLRRWTADDLADEFTRERR